MVGIEVKDPEFWEKLLVVISKNLDFVTSNYSQTFLKRRVEVRLRATNLNSYKDYADFLVSNAEEKQKLDKELTIHVTNFFRDSSVFEAFKNNVVPELVKRKKLQGKKTISVWCAGCSTGEEPIGVAICFLEALKTLGSSFSVNILGTDLDAHTIQKAQEGVYENIQFREMKPEYKEKYFETLEPGRYRVKNEIKSLINYRTGDILSPNKPKNLDVLFCRNTVIYFDLPTKSKLYTEFYDCIENEGFLILGKTEILQGEARDKFKVFDAKERIYIKKE